MPEIRAVIFDLDGTLVETERLKAESYAAVAQDLLGLQAPDERALSLYERMVGSTDEMVATAMIEELGLSEGLAARSPQPDRRPSWEAMHELRLDVYRSRFGTPARLRRAAYRHNLSLARHQAAAGRLIAVATSSFTDEATRVLEVLGLAGQLDAIIGREQVVNPKPDPEIYLKTAGALGVLPQEALVVEDSLIGVSAARAAGMPWIAVSNPFSEQALRSSPHLRQEWVVYRPERVGEVAARRIADHEKGGQRR